MTRPWTEPQSPGPLGNTDHYTNIYIYIYIYDIITEYGCHYLTWWSTKCSIIWRVLNICDRAIIYHIIIFDRAIIYYIIIYYHIELFYSLPDDCRNKTA